MNVSPQPAFQDVIDANRDWFEAQVVAACCKDPGFSSRVKDTLCVHPSEPDRLQEDFPYPVDNLIYRITRRYREETAGHAGMDLVPVDYINATLKAMEAKGEVLADQIQPAVLRFQFLLTQLVEGILPQLADHVGYWLARSRIQKAVTVAANDPTYRRPEELASEINQAVALQNKMGAEKSEHEFGDGWTQGAPDVQRLATGITKFDVAVGGGLGYGEFTLFIAGQGAGKTVTACQLAATFAACGRDGVLITTEQPSVELERRIVSNCCNLPFHLIKDGLHLEKLPPDKAAAVAQLREQFKKRLLILEWRSDRAKSMTTDLREEIRAYREKRGKNPDWLIIDWIGGGLGPLSPQQLQYFRLIYQQLANELGGLAERENIVVVGFIQANTVSAKNKLRIDSTDIAECKTAGQRATTIVGISALQETEEAMEDAGTATYQRKQYWFVSKARKGTGGLVPVDRDFGYQRFRNWS